MKKLLSFILAVVMLFTACTPAFACRVGNTTYDDNLEELQAQFVAGKGPETNGYTIDYRYFSPVEDGDKTKYPLVIWLHGMGDGAHEGKQVTASDIAFWTSDDFQSRFKDSEGAFIFAPRSLEEENINLLSKYTNITEKEKIDIKSLRRGESLMFVDKDHLLVKITCSDNEKGII